MIRGLDRSDRSLARRTLVHVAVFAGGSALLVAILSVALIAVARALLPAPADADREEERPATTARAAAAEEARPRRRARADAEAEPAEDGEAARPARAAPESESWPKCCDALQAMTRTAPPGEKNSYMAAAGACRGLTGSAQGRQVVQHMLEGRDLPEACQ
jgi:hypothetical protein